MCIRDRHKSFTYILLNFPHTYFRLFSFSVHWFFVLSAISIIAHFVYNEYLILSTFMLLSSLLYHSAVPCTSHESTTMLHFTACQEFSPASPITSSLFSLLNFSLTLFCHTSCLLLLLLLSGDIEVNPGPANFAICTLNIRSILQSTHSAALSGLISSHNPDLLCLTETWIKHTTTYTELAHCTPPSYSLLSFPRLFNRPNNKSEGAAGGTTLIISEPFTQLPSSENTFMSFESSASDRKELNSSRKTEFGLE